HQHLGDGDRGLGVAQRAQQPLGDLLEIASRAVDRPPKALSFAFDTARGESIPDLRGLAYDHDRAADGDTAGHPAPLEASHRAASSKPRVTSAASSVTAASSSAPSASMTSVVA